MKINRYFFIYFFIFLLLTFFLNAQEYPTFEVPEKKDVARIPTSIDLGVFRIGEKARLDLTLSLEKGWYIYSLFQNPKIALPTKLDFASHFLKDEEGVFETRALQKKNSLGVELLIHQNRPSFYQNFTIPEEHKLGKESFEGNFFYQLCSDRFCFPPEQKKITIFYKVQQGPARAEYLLANREIANNSLVTGEWQKIQNLGFLKFLLLAIFSGYLAWLTPCAFAMLPLLVLFFSNPATNQRRASFWQFLFFLLGISFSFVALGLLVSSFLGVSQLLNLVINGWSFLLAAVFFLLFSLHFFGVFSWNIFVFSSLQKKQDKLLQQKNSGAFSFFKILIGGGLFSITTFSCTFPLVGSLLIAASFGSWFYPTLGMFLFAVAFISPLLLLYFFPQILTKWQGGLLVTEFRFLLGLLTFFAALKFFSYADIYFQWNFITRNFTIVFWILGLLFWVLRLCLPFLQRKTPLTKKTFFPIVASLFLLMATIFLASGLQQKSLGAFIDSILPKAKGGYLESRNSVSKEKFDSLQWFTSVQQAQALSQENQKPILIDFSGVTCTNCRLMEQSVFPQKEVFKILQDEFNLVRLYTDIGKNANKNLEYQKNQFGNIALPLYAILSKNGEIIKQHAGVMNKNEFLAFLQWKNEN